jgi:hypothetical protein
MPSVEATAVTEVRSAMEMPHGPPPGWPKCRPRQPGQGLLDVSGSFSANAAFAIAAARSTCVPEPTSVASFMSPRGSTCTPSTRSRADGLVLDLEAGTDVTVPLRSLHSPWHSPAAEADPSLADGRGVGLARLGSAVAPTPACHRPDRGQSSDAVNDVGRQHVHEAGRERGVATDDATGPRAAGPEGLHDGPGDLVG